MDESNVPHKVVRLDSLHAKQMCWEDKGGSLGKIWCEVVDQILDYENNKHDIDDVIDKSFEETVERSMNEINQNNKKSLRMRRKAMNQYIKSKAKAMGKTKMGNAILERRNRESSLDTIFTSSVSGGRAVTKPRIFTMRIKGWRQKKKVKNPISVSQGNGKKRKILSKRLTIRKVRRSFSRGIRKRNQYERETVTAVDEKQVE